MSLIVRVAISVLIFAIGGCDSAPPPPPAPVTPVAVNLPQPRADAMVLIPAGEFIMGSAKLDTENKAREFGYSQPWYVDEHPQRKVNLPAYYIDQFEVNNAAFAKFMLTTARGNTKMLSEQIPKQPPAWADQPVANIVWQYAYDYCAWAGKRLPSEAEWEKAARGTDGRDYPWGNAWDAQRANAGGGSGVLPVGSFANGVSPYGVHDMAGNVSEWVQDWYQPYPGADFKSQWYGETHKVVRGGGWGGIGHYAVPYFYRTSFRDYEQPARAFNDIGFRCAKDAGR